MQSISNSKTIGYAIPIVEGRHESLSSRLKDHKHTTLKVSPYTQSIHSTPSGNPHPITQILSCYYYQDLHISSLHIHSRKSFNRIISPSYLTQSISLQIHLRALANYIPSIFSNVRFGRYVVTRFLADANFHGHRPTVSIKPSDSFSFA